MQEYCNQVIKENFNKKLTLTINDERKYTDSEICWICNEKLDETKVRDHCHITGNYRGTAHNQCNLKLKIPKKLPIIFII